MFTVLIRFGLSSSRSIARILGFWVSELGNSGDWHIPVDDINHALPNEGSAGFKYIINHIKTE